MKNGQTIATQIETWFEYVQAFVHELVACRVPGRASIQNQEALRSGLRSELNVPVSRSAFSNPFRAAFSSRLNMGQTQ
jgi:hypothetical protein